MIVSTNPQINLNRLCKHIHVLESFNVLFFWPWYGWGGSSLGFTRNAGVRNEANPCGIYGGQSILGTVFSRSKSASFLRYQCTNALTTWVKKLMAPSHRDVWILHGVAKYFWVLSLELASCHPSDAKTREVPPRFPETFVHPWLKASLNKTFSLLTFLPSVSSVTTNPAS